MGADVNEFVEIAAPANADLEDWGVYLYNGATGNFYDGALINIGGTVPESAPGSGVGFVVLDDSSFWMSDPFGGLMDGAGGIALVDDTNAAVEFVSYGGAPFVAQDGPAAGLTSTDVGVAESGSTPTTSSIGRTLSGSAGADFTWAELDATNGAVNDGQTFV